jgi:hypothetical protein
MKRDQAGNKSVRIDPQSPEALIKELEDVLQRHSIPEEIIARLQDLDFTDDQAATWESLVSIIDEALQSKSW